MRMTQKLVIICAAISIIDGCAYRHYLGFHGPSIKLYPDVHDQVTDDDECLACHHPDRDPEGPATSHPDFKGCLKCHNDDIT